MFVQVTRGTTGARNRGLHAGWMITVECENSGPGEMNGGTIHHHNGPAVLVEIVEALA